MCYLEACEELIIFTFRHKNTKKLAHQPEDKKENEAMIVIKVEEEQINSSDLDLFFRSIGSTFITYITSSTLNNLVSSSVIKHQQGTNLDHILCNNSLLKIFSSEIDMKERCKSFNSKYGESGSIEMESSIWNLSYFNIFSNKFQSAYNHNMMMKMMISYICINGMHPFLGINCDEAPHCQWSDSPQCRIRSVFEKLLENKDLYDINEYDFDYREAWRMRESSSNLLIDVNEMMQFLFMKQNNLLIDADALDSFRNDTFTLFTFRNECDYTHKIQFDIIQCTSNLDVIDNFKISLFGKKIYFGTYPMNNNMDKRLWNKIKNIVLGHTFVDIRNWWIISIQSIDTSVEGVEQNNCYYLICAEVDGTHVNNKREADHMYSKLLVWKSCFYSEEQPYGHE